MTNKFQEAFKTVELVWDFERRTVLEGVIHEDIRRAVLSVDAIDMDSLSSVERDMAELLHETVREACRIYEYRENHLGSARNPILSDHFPESDIEIRIHHIPELFYTDVNNEYQYKRKAVAVSEYPEGFGFLKYCGKRKRSLTGVWRRDGQ